MRARVCFIYPWATFGGVERVLLNRALAFKNYLPKIKIDLLFLHDSGGLPPLRAAISQYGLNENVSIVSSLDSDYDLVSIIDCPQAIEYCIQRSQRYIVECHTAYVENRVYLRNLPSSCDKVITPSFTFSEHIRQEIPNLSLKLGELRNFVPWDISPQEAQVSNFLPEWKRKPILFFGRLDRLKDPISVLDAFQMIETRRPNEFMLLLCGPKSAEININNEILKRSLNYHSAVLPPIPFSSARRLLDSVAHLGGIFVSPSKGESFGLSAAEAISSMLPVVLSDIKPHVDLVNGYQNKMTYRVGDVCQLADSIQALFDDYATARNAVANLRNAFSAATFIEDWKKLFNELEIA